MSVVLDANDGEAFRLETEAVTETLRTARAVVSVDPKESSDGTHQHLSVKMQARRRLVARKAGRDADLQWKDTDEVSHCPPSCDGGHETWYVQRLVCPLCEDRLSAIEGEDAFTILRGWDLRLSAIIPEPAGEVMVTGLADRPITFRGSSVVHFSMGDAHVEFEGLAFVGADTIP